MEKKQSLTERAQAIASGEHAPIEGSSLHMQALQVEAMDRLQTALTRVANELSGIRSAIQNRPR